MSNDLKNLVGEYLKQRWLDKEISWEKVQEISLYLDQVIREGMTEEEIRMLIPTLDDKFPELTNLVTKLLVQNLDG